MEKKQRIAVRAQITYEIEDYRENHSDDYMDHYEDDFFDHANRESEPFTLEFDLLQARDDFIEALERWGEYIPDEHEPDDIEEGFGMMQFDDTSYDDEDMAEYGLRKTDAEPLLHKSVPQKIVIYFNDGSEEDFYATDLDDTMDRVIDLIG
jgi:hypothetical protein